MSEFELRIEFEPSDHSTLFDYMNMNTWDWTTVYYLY